MLIKPFVPKKETKVSIKSLPSGEIDPRTKHPAYFGTVAERNESIENEGRLLMLTTMYLEFDVMQNKKIHDTGNCERSWAVCKCRFASKIRALDIGVRDNGEW